MGNHANRAGHAGRKAKLVIAAESVSASVGFYTDVLQWRLASVCEKGRYALLSMPGGESALLVERGAADETAAALAEPGAARSAPGERFFISVPEEGDENALEPLKQRAAAAGAVASDEIEPLCWRTLTIRTPEGGLLAHWQEFDASDEQIVGLFASGPDRLEAALAGLPDGALDLSLAPGKWSIRQQVLHLVDLDMAAAHKLKFIVADDAPGRTYAASRFEQDRWAEGMRYAERPIAAEVALFRLLREHLLAVCRVVPGALARSVIVSGGRTETAGRLMKSMAGHANGHIRRIEQIRLAASGTADAADPKPETARRAEP
ncbi:DinB family protein [Paenibacillus sp. GYB003]|uniref:DinB family protein n=1 Tax=Paenibacillus sp. GYB003 TaxID=2994392 RepID=UPI002F9691D9